MKYTMTTPCDACPFLKGSGFTWRSLNAHASGEFGCHKACKLSDDDEGTYVPLDKTPHCAGALIFLEKQDRPHQMMRICERIGMYDRAKLNMAAPVAASPKDCRRESKRDREMRAEPLETQQINRALATRAK
jgi:hypothetical protein